MTTTKQALDRINGVIVKDSIIYYDDSTRKYYVGPVSDLDYLRELMSDEDEDVSRDAYSHWCAGTTHGDGFDTEEEAEHARVESGVVA